MCAEDILKECLDRGISCVGVQLKDGHLGYEVSGFSKSGTALIYDTDDGVICETRYNRLDYIDDFIDLARIAFSWNAKYLVRGYNWAEEWVPVFLAYGWIKATQTTTYKIM